MVYSSIEWLWLDFTNKLSFVSFCIVLHRFGWPIKRNLGPFCTCSKNHQNLVLPPPKLPESGWNVQTNRPTNHNLPPQVVGTVEVYLSLWHLPLLVSWKPLSPPILEREMAKKKTGDLLNAEIYRRAVRRNWAVFKVEMLLGLLLHGYLSRWRYLWCKYYKLGILVQN